MTSDNQRVGFYLKILCKEDNLCTEAWFSSLSTAYGTPWKAGGTPPPPEQQEGQGQVGQLQDIRAGKDLSMDLFNKT